MRRFSSFLCGTVLLLLACAVPVHAQQASESQRTSRDSQPGVKPRSVVTRGSVTVEGQQIRYEAEAGTVVLENDTEEPTAEIFFVAYTRRGVEDASDRPVTFLYNGGPGASSMWLHMAAFGPRRVETTEAAHTPAAPYSLVRNEHSLLDATDLVFIDAPGTGFSRILDAGEPDDFYGTDADARAFTDAITRYLTRAGRWNSPKYLLGESYGTTRSAVVARYLQNRESVDLNGIVALSQTLNHSFSVDLVATDPGATLPYQLALPTYAASAWYHEKLPSRPDSLRPFLEEVEEFAMTEYGRALEAGSRLDSTRRRAVAEQLHRYTGLDVSYLLEADLRVTGGEFEHQLLEDANRTVGRLDTRFTGFHRDPLDRSAEYDPQLAAIRSALVSVFNDYIREELGFGEDRRYRPLTPLFGQWTFKHQSPGAPQPLPQTLNVMPDLAAAMTTNPDLDVMVNSGYYDLATTYYAADHELRHLPIPDELRDNVKTVHYRAGHMMYLREESLAKLHDQVSDFIRRTDNVR